MFLVDEAELRVFYHKVMRKQNSLESVPENQVLSFDIVLLVVEV